MKAKEGATVDYKNTEIGYTLRDPDGLWKEVDDKDREKDADKMLTVALGKKINLQKHEELFVHVLPEAMTPLPRLGGSSPNGEPPRSRRRNPNLSRRVRRPNRPPTDQPANTVETRVPR